MEATKKMCTLFFKRENDAKSYFRKCPNYWKTKIPEISVNIILRKLTKINIVF